MQDVHFVVLWFFVDCYGLPRHFVPRNDEGDKAHNDGLQVLHCGEFTFFRHCGEVRFLPSLRGAASAAQQRRSNPLDLVDCHAPLGLAMTKEKKARNDKENKPRNDARRKPCNDGLQVLHCGEVRFLSSLRGSPKDDEAIQLSLNFIFFKPLVRYISNKL